MTQPPTFFDEAHAASYDQQFARVGVIKDTLHLLTAIALSKLPADARILCVGAGTGAEIEALAPQFPNWHFTALDPSRPMLDICRAKARDQGFADRCSFHEGYLDSLEADEPFHAATSFLASHFLLKEDERRGYFRQISKRLLPKGILVNADLSLPFDEESATAMMDIWIQMMEIDGTRIDPSVYGRDVAVLPPGTIEQLIASGGFKTPVQFFQTLMIHGWLAERSADVT
jgi:tRNA (cmo5U34)-methyltransferase